MDKEVVAIDKSKIESLIREYMGDCRIEGNSKASLENKRGAFSRFLNRLGDRDFSPLAIKEYTNSLFERGLQPSSIATDIRKYKSFCNWMAQPERAYCPLTWPKLIKLPAIPNYEVDVPSSEIAEQIILNGTNIKKENNPHWMINQEGRDALFLMLFTGLRVNEALSLDPKDFHFENPGHEWFKVASKGKGGGKDKLPLVFPQAIEILKRPRMKDKRNKETQYFGVSEDALNTFLERGCKKMGMAKKITNHKLRHIFATDCARGGMNSLFLMKLMRHSDISITEKYYIHLQMDDWRKALQTYHPLMRKSRTTSQIMERLAEFIGEELGIKDDSRFRVISEGNKFFKIEVI